MSYGQPWRRTTAGPSAGPASAYPTLRMPASICFIEWNEMLVPGLTVGRSADCALPDGGWIPSPNRTPGASNVAPTDSPAIAKRRREISIASAFFINCLLRLECCLLFLLSMGLTEAPD